MSTESGMGSSRRNNSGAELANTTLVFQTDAAVNRDSLDHTEEQNNTAATMGRTQGSSSAQQSDASCLSDILESYEAQGISAAATSIIVSSWRPSSGDPVLENYTKATLTDGRHTVLYEKGAGYSTMNTARSALSCLVAPIDNYPMGAHLTVRRFLKGIFQLRPATPRYHNIWDVQDVLHHLKTLVPITDITLKDLTLKLTMLIALVSAQRRQSIQLLNIDYMVKDDTSYVFTIKDHIKQSRPGYTPPRI
ncbi:Hypothetical predicted protein [Paramuricea clavata]|uniref:Uncharacterized protein n=1 Tax=Paramuricea clavata TaxID=317549 RepID=A0A7D9I9L8_PARCT|nr:Hypothetical predicted protein [Paramuricea clavata]